MRISEGSSDVCSSDLRRAGLRLPNPVPAARRPRIDAARPVREIGLLLLELDLNATVALFRRLRLDHRIGLAESAADDPRRIDAAAHQELDDRVGAPLGQHLRSEEHTSELQSLMRISYAVFCLKKK